ncbi:hypothetical protein HGM15179_003200 [Zosterops borbonicus]|uniref:Uncharacterized protein n=1 Tax=Zosterops borbonicus TaxID=364589 RepID=A0A8K1LRS3_9PASS|nr:hypothetical protein HGM15179_003200 [Zosterops borbonicus]
MDGGMDGEVPRCGSRAGSVLTHLGKTTGPTGQLRVQSTGTSLQKAEPRLCPGSWDQHQSPCGAPGTATARPGHGDSKDSSRAVASPELIQQLGLLLMYRNLMYNTTYSCGTRGHPHQPSKATCTRQGAEEDHEQTELKEHSHSPKLAIPGLQGSLNTMGPTLQNPRAARVPKAQEPSPVIQAHQNQDPQSPQFQPCNPRDARLPKAQGTSQQIHVTN